MSMIDRRRLLLNNKKIFLYISGDENIQTDGVVKSHEVIYDTDHIAIGAGSVAIVGNGNNIVGGEDENIEHVQGYGYLGFEYDLTDYKKLCFEVETWSDITGAVGYSSSFSPDKTVPAYPKVYSEIIAGTPKTIVKLDVSDITGVYYIIASLVGVKNQITNIYTGVKIYNIWLE